MAKRPRYANNLQPVTGNIQPSTLAKRPRYANNLQPTLNLQPKGLSKSTLLPSSDRFLGSLIVRGIFWD
ncbi:MAG: hypothetical protein F6K26_34050 [Moorea sp. SIO2I5]|nr:hypothetical protein [Moorena sp. SIO2I5]